MRMSIAAKTYSTAPSQAHWPKAHTARPASAAAATTVLPASYWVGGSHLHGPSGPMRPGLGARVVVSRAARAVEDSKRVAQVCYGGPQTPGLNPQASTPASHPMLQKASNPSLHRLQPHLFTMSQRASKRIFPPCT